MPLAEQRGGAELMLMHLLRASRSSPSVSYSLAFLEPGPMKEEVARLGFSSCIIDAGRLRQPIHYARTVGALAQWMRTYNLNSVVSWMAKAHLYVGPASLVAGIPALWFQHGLPDGHWLDRAATLIPAKGVLACSAMAKSAQLRLKPTRPIEVIYPAVDLARLARAREKSREAIRTKLGLAPDAMIIGMAARLQRWKGIHLVVEAISKLKETFPAAQLLVIGGKHALEPGYEDWLRRHAKDCGIADRMFLAGFQSDPADWMAAMDIVVNASASEPFGMSLVEAMALARPVVAVRSGGPGEIITHEKDGLLVESASAEAIASALTRLMQEPELRTRLACNAEVRARDFGVERLCHAMADALEKRLKPRWKEEDPQVSRSKFNATL